MAKIAVITGAGAGVGRATADEFVRQGYDVALLSRDPGRLERAAEVRIAMVDLPAINTPQFDWALKKMGRKAKPVAPIFQPEAPAGAVFYAATHNRRDIWLGFSTVKAVMANRVAPGLIDRYLAKGGYSGQLTDQPTGPDAPANLWEPVPGDYGANGRFDARSRDSSWEMFTDRHKTALVAGLGALGAFFVAHQVAKRLDA